MKSRGHTHFAAVDMKRAAVLARVANERKKLMVDGGSKQTRWQRRAEAKARATLITCIDFSLALLYPEHPCQTTS